MKSIYDVAAKFIKKIGNYYPTQESVKPIIESQLNSLKKKFTNLNGVQGVALIDLKTNIENDVNLYFQLNVDSDKYNNIIKDNFNINEMFKTYLVPALESNFRGFKFKVKVGFFPN